MLLYLPGGHTAAKVNDALSAAMTVLPQELRRTLTWDQGGEMASYDKIAALFTECVCFALEPPSVSGPPFEAR